MRSQGERTRARRSVAARLLRDERGLGTVESVVIVVLVVAFCVAAWNVFGSSVGCRLAGATRAFDDPSQRGFAQCGDEAASAGGGFGEPSAGGAAGSSEGRSGADQRADAPAAPFAEATHAGATSDTAATAGAPDDTASGAGTDAARRGAGAAQATSSGGSSDGAGTSERGVGSRVADALVSMGETAVDFVQGVVAGANPLTPLMPVRPKPTFGHEIAYGVGETVGAAGGLLYDGGQIISGVVASGMVLAGTGGAALPVLGASAAQVVAGGAASVGHIANLKDGINYAMNGSEPPPRPAESGGRGGAGAPDKPPARDTPASTRRPEAHAETGSSSAQRGSGAHTRPSVSEPSATAAGGAGKLPRLLRNKMKRINNELAAGGNRGISGAVSHADAVTLGERFVGPGHKVMSNGKGLISADGLRQVRFPSAKRGIDPMTGNPFSKTGVQTNFQARSVAQGPWTSNVHLDVLP